MKHEENLQIAVCRYIAMQYPNVIFSCDLASGMKLSIGMAKKAKKMRSSRGMPDMFIAEPRNGYSGLFLELKKEDTRMAKRNGEWATPHITAQAEMLERLTSLGYKARFAIGFDGARRLIDNYLKAKP